MSWFIIQTLVIFCLSVLMVVIIVSIDTLIKKNKTKKEREQIQKLGSLSEYKYTYKNVIEKED